ncbi:MAG: T9SS type A sorting domain-containing protein [Rhodothermales bacterium]
MRLLLLALSIVFAALPASAQYEATLAADITLGFNGSPPIDFAVYDSRLFFNANDFQSGEELWVYDAATGEANLAVDINPAHNVSGPSGFTVYDGRLFFNANDGQSGAELWVYDAATSEATLVADLSSSTYGSIPRNLTIYDDRLFFTAQDDQNGVELWVYDAATAMASIASEVLSGSDSSYPLYLVVYDDRLFFQATDLQQAGPGTPTNQELWAYDASSNTITLAAEVFPGQNGSRPSGLTVYDGRLFFTATDGQSARQPWFYDAATGAAARAADLQPNGHPESPSYIVYDDRLFFDYNSADDSASKLWVLAPTIVANEPSSALQSAQLHAPHPNPVSSEASISFEIADAGPIRIEVFDVLGRRVAVLADGVGSEGEHTVTWETGSLPTGLYLIRLTAGDAVQTRRLTLAR